MEEEVLDRAALDTLRELDDPGKSDVFKEVVVLYLDDAPRYLDEARGAIASQDCEALHRAVHSLKGSSRYVGGASLADLCQELENEAAIGFKDTFKDRQEEIEAAFNRVRKALVEELGKI